MTRGSMHLAGLWVTVSHSRGRGGRICHANISSRRGGYADLQSLRHAPRATSLYTREAWAVGEGHICRANNSSR